MADTILFDLFGVIARPQSSAGMARLVETAGAAAPAFWNAYWDRRPPYDRGRLTGPGFWSRVAETLGTRFDDRRIAELVAADAASWSEVDDTMVSLVGELAASGRRVALLSNIPEDLAVHYEAHHPWFRHFEVCAFSCRIGHVKPSAGAYLWCRDALGVAADRILFVDDRAENVRAAEAAGMGGHLFTGSARLRAALN
ncbi:HAD family phosphatase [Actinomadura kijaniata]|uniref:Putative hydrolase of the HAD superfamily n=1 Tax=Actinomadura namibiensis TaxID=182080 RepID=A0A7W3QN76_ACTNM|nr:HAD family phosphatase [Actinomadura namibiensis]MBA8953246.1 putative hydrolase of the HAD superfamily [Actinomadura namibiensis]